MEQKKKSVSEMPSGIKAFSYELNYVFPPSLPPQKNVYIEVLMLSTSQYGCHTPLSHGNIL